jgi:hypothetical protein
LENKSQFTNLLTCSVFATIMLRIKFCQIEGFYGNGVAQKSILDIIASHRVWCAINIWKNSEEEQMMHEWHFPGKLQSLKKLKTTCYIYFTIYATMKCYNMLHLISGRQPNDYNGEKTFENFYFMSIRFMFSSVLELSIFFHWIFSMEHSKCFLLKVFRLINSIIFFVASHWAALGSFWLQNRVKRKILV